MGSFRGMVVIVLVAILIFVGFTVPIGRRTFFGHVANILKSDETKDLVDDVKDTSAPIVDRVKRGVSDKLKTEEQ